MEVDIFRWLSSGWEGQGGGNERESKWKENEEIHDCLVEARPLGSEKLFWTVATKTDLDWTLCVEVVNQYRL